MASTWLNHLHETQKVEENPIFSQAVQGRQSWIFSPAECVCTCTLKSCPTLYTPMDCSTPAPLSMEFSRQEYRMGLPFPSPVPPQTIPEITTDVLVARNH